MVVNPHIFEKGALARLATLCDYHMTLKRKTIFFQSNKEERVITKMRVLKLNGVELEGRTPIRFEILPGEGIKTIPLSKIYV